MNFGISRAVRRVLASRLALGAALCGGFGACATAPRTYELDLAVKPETAVRVLERALRDEGLACAVVDERRGVVATTWRDSGREVIISPPGADLPDTADVFRRYRIVVVPTAGVTKAFLQVDGRRCVSGDRVDEGSILSRCTDSTEDDAGFLRHDFQALTARLARRTAAAVTILPRAATEGLAYWR